MNTALLATAYHEAGHAVVARYLGVEVLSVEIHDDNSGVCRHVPLQADLELLPDEDARRIVEPRVVIYFAGQLAEARFLGQHPETFDGHEIDDESAIDFALFLCRSEDEAAAYHRWLFERARNFVNMSWPFIEDVAAELVESRHMTGEEVGAAMSGTPAH